MKKVIYNQFGSSDVLEIIETDIPKMSPQDILIQVKAVSINPVDWKIFHGSVKMLSGKKFPKSPGLDFSGTIVETGKQVKEFQVGDDVFGTVTNTFKEGALAEYVTAASAQLALKPSDLSYPQAAALPSVGAPVIMAFEDKFPLQSHQEVLIHGASGGVGMIAIQVAKQTGSIVTAVSSTKGLSYMKAWGADVVLDYTQEDVLACHKQFDVILELSGRLSFTKANTIMKDNAVFLTLMGAGSMRDLIVGYLSSLFSRRQFSSLVASPTKRILLQLSEYVEHGLRVHIGDSFSFNDVKTAYAEIEKRGTIGKAVIEMSSLSQNMKNNPLRDSDK